MTNNSIIIDRGRLDSAFRLGFIGKILKESKKINAIVLTEKSQNHESLRIYKDMGISKFIFWQEEKKKFSNFFLLFLALIHTICLSLLLVLTNLKKKITKLKFHDIKIGDLILDHSLRFDNNFYLKNKINFSLLKILFSTIYKLLILKKIFKINKIKLTIFSSFSYATLSSIGMRLSISKKIKCIYSGGSQLIVLKKEIDYVKGFYSLKKKEIVKFAKNLINQKKLNKFFKARIEPKKIKLKKNYMKELKKENWDTYRAFQNKKNITKKKLYQLLGFEDYNKPLCVFALHAFKDANNIYGEFLFDSFFEEFLETANYLKNRNEYYWVAKPHPAGDRLGEKNLVQTIIKKNDLKNIKILPKSISTKTIILNADKIVTSRGTIGLEYASVGKKPIITSNTYYSKFNIATLCKNKDDYFKNLIKINTNNRLNKKQIMIAKSILFKRKVEYIKDNIYNFTHPEIETGKKIFFSEYKKKKYLFNSKKSWLYQIYREKLAEEKILQI